MLYSEVEKLVTNWVVGTSKVFYCYFMFFDKGIVIIKRVKEDLFEVDKERSTDILGPFTKDEMIKCISSGGLEYIISASEFTNYRELLSGGCVCGAWRTSNPDLHALYCPRYRNPIREDDD